MQDAILDFLSLKVCQHFANLPLDTCSEDVEVWVRKKTLLYPREINLRLSFIHYSFHKDAGGAAAFFSTLWIRSTAAALSHKNGVSASPRKQDKRRNRNSICLRLLVPLGFWVSCWNAAIVATSWRGSREIVRTFSQCEMFGEYKENKINFRGFRVAIFNRIWNIEGDQKLDG